MQIEKRPVSYAQLVGWAGLAVTQAFLAGVIWATVTSRIENLETDSARRAAQTTATIAEIKAETDDISNLAYRLGQAEERDKAQDARIDRIVESVNNKLDTINENVNGVRTDLRVLSSKVETSLNGSTDVKPTSFRPSRP